MIRHNHFLVCMVLWAATVGVQWVPATTIQFDDIGSNNTQVPNDYGSRVSRSGVGFVTTDGSGATPNISLTWNDPTRWDYHGSAVWTELEQGIPVDVMQIDRGGTGASASSISFVPDPGYRVHFHTLRIGHASDQVEAPFAWTIRVERESDHATVYSFTTLEMGPGGVTLVPIGFAGEPGVSYRLVFDDGGASSLRAAIDDLGFSQSPGGDAAFPQIIAHRGNSLFAPENTLVAFVQAAAISDFVEMDIRASADGALVAMHDPTVDRTSDGTGQIDALTLAQAKALDAGSWFGSAYAGASIPTLEESIQATWPAATPLIEHKAGSAQAYVNAIQSLNASANVVVMSFDWNFLDAMRSLDATIPRVGLGSGPIVSAILDDAVARGFSGLSWSQSDLSATTLALARAHGLSLYVWTANGSDIQRHVDLGVDGITTDDPALAGNLTRLGLVSRVELAEGLASYRKFDDGLLVSNAMIAADVEELNPGTLQGFDPNPAWVTGNYARHGGALELDGIDDHVSVPASTNLDIQANCVSISAWVNLSVKPLGIPEPFSGIYDSEQDAYILYLDKSSNELRFKVTDSMNDAERPGIPASALNVGAWHHVVGVYDGSAGAYAGQARIYLDGKLMDVHTASSGNLRGVVRPGQVAAIGKNGSQDIYWFAGTVDDLSVWRRALDSAAIVQLLRGRSLERQIVSLETIQPRFLRLNDPAFEFNVEVVHGLLSPSDLHLQKADQPGGMFAPDTSAMVQALGRNRFRFTLPVPVEGDPSFYRVAYP
jgi:glycerophosphoryl diester phosphodiesterase